LAKNKRHYRLYISSVSPLYFFSVNLDRLFPLLFSSDFRSFDFPEETDFRFFFSATTVVKMREIIRARNNQHFQDALKYITVDCNCIESIITEFRQKEEDPLDREMKLEAINASKQQADYYKFMMNNK
jgi:hypothetical protein